MALTDPDQPESAIVDWVTDEDGIEWGVRNDGKRLKSAKHNRWYVLSTLWGEQDGNSVDGPLTSRNRHAWNAWAGQHLDQEERAFLSTQLWIDPAELKGWDKLGDEIVLRFRDRMGEGYTLPDPSELVQLAHTAFQHRLVWSQYLIPAEATFARSTFESGILFNETAFRSTAAFRNATFREFALFEDATFNDMAFFEGAFFIGKGVFSASKFLSTAKFINARFADEASFSNSKFSANAFFNACSFTAKAEFSSATFTGPSYFRKTQFSGVCEFDDAFFERPASFRAAMFDKFYPKFTGAILHPRTEFSGRNTDQIDKKFQRLWPTEPLPQTHLRDAIEAAATMRHAVANQGLPEEEHFFFHKEMTLKREFGPDVESGGWFGWKLNGIFWRFSDYGRSVGWPAWYLLLVWLVPMLVYWLAFAWPSAPEMPFGSAGTGMALSFANTFGFLGFQRVYFDIEFIRDLHWSLQLMGATQTVLGVVFLFFLGLGLRTRFRLR